MTTEQIQAGSSVESTCRKCKAVTDHHVVVMIEEKVGKVLCKVCGGQHAYRPPKETPKPKPTKTTSGEKVKKTAASKKTAVPKKPSQEILALWETKVGSATQQKILPYAMSGNFQEGDVINHAMFGLGYVQKFIKPNMIEVLFQHSVKNMRCCA